MAGNFRDHRTYLVPLLRALCGRGATAPTSIYEQVADAVGVSKEQREIVSARDTDNPVYRNRIQFARQALIDAGLLIGSSDPRWQRGLWQLTPEGERLAREARSDARLDEELRRLAAEGTKRRTQERRRSRALAGLTNDESISTPPRSDPSAADEDDDEVDEPEDEETIAELVDEANAFAMQQMLAHIRSMSDSAFEHLVGRVLQAALRAEHVEITPKSRDGGVDGLLYFDDLKLRVAVFEAKRYAEGSNISRPQIDAFSTAARRRKAAHALFVTSSGFTPEAAIAAREEGIRPIDGMAFVELMARHEIGLRAKRKLVLYELDPAWAFEETLD